MRKPTKPLLFLSPRVPYPLNTGAKIRTHALLRSLSKQYMIDYMGFLQPDLTRGEALEQLSFCQQVHLHPEPATSLPGKGWLAMCTLLDKRPVTIAKYWNKELARRVDQWAAQNPTGIIHADHLHMAPYLCTPHTCSLKAMDEHNVETCIVQRMAQSYHRTFVRPYLKVQASRMDAIESRLAAHVDLITAVSDGDAELLGQMAPRSRVEVIPNGVNPYYFSPPPQGRTPIPGRLVFTGSMDWLPNQDGILWFSNEIWPLLNRQFAGEDPWTLDVVGHRPSSAVQALAGPQVRVTGSVEDVRPYVHSASVFIVPLRIGGGSRLKILEAFSMGIPVVSTAVGCEGLGVEHGKQLLIADTPEDFCRAIQELTFNPQLQQNLAETASYYVRQHFTWAAIGKKLVGLYQEAQEKNKKRPRVVRNLPVGIGL